MPKGPTLTRQWEKVGVMRKTVNLRTTMRMDRGLDFRVNDQEQDGESDTVSTSELVQYVGQLHTTVVTLLHTVKSGEMSTRKL